MLLTVSEFHGLWQNDVLHSLQVLPDLEESGPFFVNYCLETLFELGLRVICGQVSSGIVDILIFLLLCLFSFVFHLSVLFGVQICFDLSDRKFCLIDEFLVICQSADFLVN